jgi:GNAT superfamily N-acetyltransferase
MKAYRYIRTSGVQIIQDEPNLAIVEDLYVDPDDRGKHIGKRLMEGTCRDADRENVTLILKPLPFGSYDKVTETYYPPTMTYKELCDFYRSFGFRFMPHSEMMKRKPKDD